MRYIRILTVVSWLIMTLSLSPDACRKRRLQCNERNNTARRKRYADDEAYRGEADLADLPDLADADLAALPVKLVCSSARQSEMRSRRKVRFSASAFGEGAEILASS